MVRLERFGQGDEWLVVGWWLGRAWKVVCAVVKKAVVVAVHSWEIGFWGMGWSRKVKIS